MGEKRRKMQMEILSIQRVKQNAQQMQKRNLPREMQQLLKMYLNNSTLVVFWLLLLQDLDKVDVQMDIFLKERNWISTPKCPTRKGNRCYMCGNEKNKTKTKIILVLLAYQ